MKNVIWFVLGVALSSVAVGTLYGSEKNQTVTSVKSETILGHRIGPGGQSMLVVK